jgi:hypothetical protein
MDRVIQAVGWWRVGGNDNNNNGNNNSIQFNYLLFMC